MGTNPHFFSGEHQPSLPLSTSTMPDTYTVAPHLAYFDIPLSHFAASRPEFESFGVGGYIISKSRPTPACPGLPRVLLLQRALTDAMPGSWEGPGGACEPDTDKTILDGVAREVLEETGLHVSRVVELVGVDGWQHTRRNGTRFRIAKYSFLVEIHEATRQLPYGSLQSLPCEEFPVRLEDTEHQAFEWATEGKVRQSHQTSQGKYTLALPPSGHQGANILRAFDLFRGMVGEKSA